MKKPNIDMNVNVEDIKKELSLLGSLRNVPLPWEKLRNPQILLAEIPLTIAFPVILWTHDVFFLILWAVLLLAHPWFFADHVESAKDGSRYTKIVDAFRDWCGEADLVRGLLLYIPLFALFVPLVIVLWGNLLVWSIYFFVAIAAFKAVFSVYLLQNQDDSAVIKTVTEKATQKAAKTGKAKAKS